MITVYTYACGQLIRHTETQVSCGSRPSSRSACSTAFFSVFSSGDGFAFTMPLSGPGKRERDPVRAGWPSNVLGKIGETLNLASVASYRFELATLGRRGW